MKQTTTPLVQDWKRRREHKMERKNKSNTEKIIKRETPGSKCIHTTILEPHTMLESCSNKDKLIDTYKNSPSPFIINGKQRRLESQKDTKIFGTTT